LDTDPTFGVFFMVKYDERFKQQIVDEYLNGDAGAKSLSRRYGLHYALVEHWVARFREHGEAGLRRKYSHYDARFKLMVLQRMWCDALSYRQVAALFNVRNPASVTRWERLYHEGGLDALVPLRRGRPPTVKSKTHTPPPELDAPNTRSREDLLKENEYLRAEVAYLKKLDALLREKEQAAQKKKRG
jgi:transposase